MAHHTPQTPPIGTAYGRIEGRIHGLDSAVSGAAEDGGGSRDVAVRTAVRKYSTFTECKCVGNTDKAGTRVVGGCLGLQVASRFGLAPFSSALLGAPLGKSDDQRRLSLAAVAAVVTDQARLEVSLASSGSSST
ncbi:hypothetical protein ACCO45_008918 [Purpureocillium lilacinum]|uniref:Uncharacterized protein n=1 Tax=Purpureocillium lilacinum TaxID=33203 RepID=A0ACC4DJT0_PURLI